MNEYHTPAPLSYNEKRMMFVVGVMMIGIIFVVPVTLVTLLSYLLM
jgi:hypothetical protein